MDLKKFTLICALGLVTAGCASVDNQEAAAADDPLEPMNRTFFDLNQSLDRHAILPAATFYNDTVPAPARHGVHNFLTNLSGPVNFANEILEAHFRKAGVAEPTPKMTWVEFMAQAPKLVQDFKGDGKINAWAIDTYFARDQLTPTIWQAILNAHGGKLLDEHNKAAFNTKEGVATLQLFVDLLKYAPPGAKSHIFNEELQAFRQNQLATMFMWGSAYRGAAVDPATTTLKPEDVGIQVMPVGSVSAGTHRGIWSGVISKRTPHPAAAWRFLQWLSSKDGERLSGNATGSFPARRSTLAATPDNAWQVPVFATLRQAYDLAEAGKMWRPRLAKSDAVQQILADEVALATAGDNTAKDALKRAADRIDRLRL